MVVIVDYGMGNLGSILNKIERLGAEVIISSNAKDIEEAGKLILPGIGTFVAGVEKLINYNLLDILNKKVLADKIPVLGICLGMQLMTKKSEEGNVNGFGWIEAETKRFIFEENNIKLKIPHIGWNSLNIKRNSSLLKDIPTDAEFYFVHSYHVCCAMQDDVILATTHYGYDFISAIQKENIFGTQFHPEKSHKHGIKIIENFINLC